MILARSRAATAGSPRTRAAWRWALGFADGRARAADCRDHPSGCPAPRPGFAYFVSLRRGDAVVVLAGPYSSHHEALARRPDVVELLPFGEDPGSCISTAVAPYDYRALLGRV